MKRKVFVVFSLVLVLIIAMVAPVSAAATRSKLLPDSSNYVSGTGSVSFSKNSNNTVTVSLSIRKLSASQSINITVYRDSVELGSSVCANGSCQADARGNCQYSLVASDETNFPNGFTGYQDFKVTILNTSSYDIMSSNWITLNFS